MSTQKNKQNENPFAPYQLLVDQNTPINAENTQISGNPVQREQVDNNWQYMRVVSFPDFKPDNKSVAVEPDQPREGQTGEQVGPNPNTIVEISAPKESTNEPNQSVNNAESDAPSTIQPTEDNSVMQVTTAMSPVEDKSFLSNSVNTNQTDFIPYTFPQGEREKIDNSIDSTTVINKATPQFDNSHFIINLAKNDYVFDDNNPSEHLPNNPFLSNNASSSTESATPSNATNSDDRNIEIFNKIQAGISEEEMQNHREWEMNHPGLMNLNHENTNANNPEKRSLVSKAASWLKRQIGAFHSNEIGSFSFFEAIATWEKKKAENPKLQWVETPAKLITGGVAASYGLQSIIGLSAIQNALYVGGMMSALPWIASIAAVPVLAGVAAWKIAKYRYDSAKLQEIAGSAEPKDQMNALRDIRLKIAAKKQNDLNAEEKLLLEVLDDLWKDSHAEKTSFLGRDANATFCLLKLWTLLKDGKSLNACQGKDGYEILKTLAYRLPPPTPTPTTPYSEEQEAALNTLRRIAIAYERELHTGKLSALATGAGIGAMYALSPFGLMPMALIGVPLLATEYVRRKKLNVIMGPRGYIVGNNGINTLATHDEIKRAKRLVSEELLKKYTDRQSYASHPNNDQINVLVAKLTQATIKAEIPPTPKKNDLAKVLGTYMTDELLALGKPKLGDEDKEKMKRMKEKIEELKAKITQAKIDQSVVVENSVIASIQSQIDKNLSEIQDIKNNNSNKEVIAPFVAQNTALQKSLEKYTEINNNVLRAKIIEKLANEEKREIETEIGILQKNATTETASDEVASIALAVVTNEKYKQTPRGNAEEKAKKLRTSRSN